MLHLKKNPKNTTKQIKIYKLKKQKISMHCKIKKPFFGEPNKSKLKIIQKAKNFYELQNKKNYYSIDADKHTTTKNKI